jgi:hypothetical protein
MHPGNAAAIPEVRKQATLSFLPLLEIGPDRDRDLGVELHDWLGQREMTAAIVASTPRQWKT